MKLKRKRKYIRVSLFSTADIAFLLLIFIMLVSLINYRKEVKIYYPEARTTLRTSAEKNLEVWLNREGTLFLNGDVSDRLELELTIAELYRTAPDTRVHIIADRNTPYKEIDSILEILQILQYRVVSFVVRSYE